MFRAPIVLAASALMSLAQAPHFDTEVTNIHVQVSVTQDGRVVSGLQAGDFAVRDEGEPQTIIAVGQESVPVDLVLLLDLSGSMHRDLRELAAIARTALMQLQPQDQVAVVSFSTEAHLEQPLTSDTDAAAKAVQRTASRGVLDTMGTRLISPISAALRLVSTGAYGGGSKAITRRRAILVVTDNLPGGRATNDDSGDRFEPTSDAGIIRDLLAASTVLDTIVVYRRHVGTVLPPPRENPGNPSYTQENAIHIARSTGGEAVISASMKDSFPDLLTRIRTRYSIWYRPPKAQPGAFRRISVSLNEAAQRRYPRARLAAREGYYAR